MPGIRLPAAMLAGLVLGCSKSDSTGPTPTGTIEIRVADAPAGDFQSVTVFVSDIALQQPASADVLVSADDLSFDMTELTDGATPVLVSSAIAVGRYSTLSVVVDSALVTLKPGRSFPGGSATAPVVPAGGLLKLDLGETVSIIEGSTLVLLMDVDASRSFQLQGPAAAPTGAVFKPAVRAISLDRAGSISGTVMPAGSGAAVYAIRGADTIQTAFANTTTGTFTLRYLPPATYITAARAPGFQVGLSLPIEVAAAASISGINLTLTTLP